MKKRTLQQSRDMEVRRRSKKQFLLWAKQWRGVREYVANRQVRAHILELSKATEPGFREAPGFSGGGGQYKIPSTIILYVPRNWVQSVLNEGLSVAGKFFALEATPVEGLPAWEATMLGVEHNQLATSRGFLTKTPTGLVTHHNLLALMAERSAILKDNSVLQSVAQATTQE